MKYNNTCVSYLLLLFSRFLFLKTLVPTTTNPITRTPIMEKTTANTIVVEDSKGETHLYFVLHNTEINLTSKHELSYP